MSTNGLPATKWKKRQSGKTHFARLRRYAPFQLLPAMRESVPLRAESTYHILSSEKNVRNFGASSCFSTSN